MTLHWHRMTARERDVAVATLVILVMGSEPFVLAPDEKWSNEDGTPDGFGDAINRHGGLSIRWPLLPEFSTSPTDCALVIEAMRAKGIAVELYNGQAETPGEWVCVFSGEGVRAQADADTMPECVAIAALRALGVTVETEGILVNNEQLEKP
jgi:hypothetical protein